MPSACSATLTVRRFAFSREEPTAALLNREDREILDGIHVFSPTVLNKYENVVFQIAHGHFYNH